MTARLRIALGVVAVALLIVASALPAFAVGYVTDESGVLPAESVQRIEALSAALEKSSAAAPQVAVLVVKDLGGKDIDSYAEERFEALGVGQSASDNGVLFVIAPTERKARIEVGYGLEGAIPDALAGAILDEKVFPAFKSGDMAGGTEAGHRAIVAAVAEEYGVSVAGVSSADVPEATPADSGDDSWILGFFVLFFIISAVVGLIRRIFRGKRAGKDSDGGWWGGFWDGGSSSGGDSGGSFGGFGGGDSGGGGASGGW